MNLSFVMFQESTLMRHAFCFTQKTLLTKYEPVIMYLLQHGARLEITLLRKAIINGYLKVVNFALDHPQPWMNLKSLLLLAARYEHLSVVQCLVDRGVNIHYQQDAPFRHAIYHGQMIVAKYLLDRGADIHALKDAAFLSVVKRGGPLSVVQFLVDHGADFRVDNDAPLRHAAAWGHFYLVEYLIEKGANVNAVDEYALRWSVKRGHLRVIQYLVNHGANVASIQHELLTDAARYGYLSVVQYLVEHCGVAVNNDCKAERVAVMNHHWSILRYLHNMTT